MIGSQTEQRAFGESKSSTRAASLARLGSAVLAGLVWIWIAMAIAAPFLTTLGADEAWVLNGLKSYLHPAVPYLSSEPIKANGGLFALANLGLEYAFGSRLWIHRLFSLACLLLLLAMVSWRARWRRPAAALDYVAIAPFLGVPGTAEVGTAALGTSTGAMLLVLASRVWTASEAPRPGRVIIAGILFGLAASSRFDLALFAPALILVSSVDFDRGFGPRLAFPWSALGAVFIALGLFAANHIVMSWAAHALVTASPNISAVMAGTGVSAASLLDYPKTLNRLFVGLGFAGPGLLVLASVVAFWPPAGEPHPGPGSGRRFAIVTLAIACALGLGWVLGAPIPHLRYLWPSLALFAILGGIGLSRIYGAYAVQGESMGMAVCLLVALGLVLGGIGGTFRSLVMGESDYMSFEWSREMGADYFRRFQHVKDQRAAVEYLRNGIPKDAIVLSHGPEHALRYLGERPVVHAGGQMPFITAKSQRTFLVLTPGVGTYQYLRPETFTWIEAHGRLKAQFGRYSFYELPDGPPDDPDVLVLSRTNYERHPGSEFWFGRGAPRAQ
jgi:hypothetical protein